MLPVTFDLTRIPVLLAGQGPLLAKRRALLREAGATQVTVMEGVAGFDEALASAGIVFVAGLDRDSSQQLADKAHARGLLVNVEDINDLCDFYFTSTLRRGDLLIAVSTCGTSPTLARKVRDAIAAWFGEEWAGRVQEMAQYRKGLKAQGAGMQEVSAKSEAFVRDKGWLAKKDEAA